MATDSTFEEMEPRVVRPAAKLWSDKQGLQVQGQVSEPSLYGASFLSGSNFPIPWSSTEQVSPVRNPGLIASITPYPVPTNLRGTQNPSCGLTQSHEGQLLPPSARSSTSPPLNPELKHLIQDQNQQLQLLRRQVEQLLQYQEKLHKQSEQKEKFHESTQTSFLNMDNSLVKMIPKVNSCSPLKRVTQDRTEMTLTFRDLQLETILERSLNESTNSSISVAMHEYQESISEKEPENDAKNSCGTIMEQVHRLLAQAEYSDPKLGNKMKKISERNSATQQLLDNPVRKATVQRVQELGISFITPTSISTVPRTSMSYSRFNAPKLSCPLDSRKETDQSVEMQRLAEKYLGSTRSCEQRREFQTKMARSVEMSMTSQQYLERYGLQVDSYSPR